MKVQYPISTSIFKMNINNAYSIKVRTITFLPMGDSAYSYYLQCENGDRFYLKLFDLQNDRQRKSLEQLTYNLPLLWQLYHRKIFLKLTYPIKNQNQNFITSFNKIKVVLFNFIEGETLANAFPLSHKTLKSIATVMASIHNTTKDIADYELLEESYNISFESNLRNCISLLDKMNPENQVLLSLREEVLAKKEEIFNILNRIHELRGKVKKNRKNKVLCHGDLWGGNLISHEKELYVVDWDSALFAPPEYDLFPYIGQNFETFYPAYRQEMRETWALNHDLLRFYAFRHHLRNLANWLMNILHRNTEEMQNENDLEMILNHCINRWERIEEDIKMVGEVERKMGKY